MANVIDKVAGHVVGPQGPQGPQGPKGDTGQTGPQGATGATGATPNLTMGTVTTLEPDSQATATITGTAENPVLNLGLPKGRNGEVSQDEFDEVAGDVNQLKNTLSIVSDITITEETTTETVTENIFSELTWESRYMDKNGNFGGGDTYRHSNKVSVSTGDIVAFANSNFSFSFITAYNGDTIIPESGQQGGNSYTVPSGIDGVILSEYVSRGDAAINHTYTNTTTTYKNILDGDIADLNTQIDAIKDMFDTYEYTDHVQTDYVPTFTTGAVDQNGTIYSGSAYLSYQYSQKIPITSGATVECLDALGNQVKMRWVCAYKGTFAVSASGTNADVYKFTPTGDIDSIVVTCRISGSAVLVRVATPTEKTAFFANAKPIPMGYLSNVGNLSDGQGIYLPRTNVKNENVLIFNANITSFGAVKIGKPDNTYVVVDDTNITLHNTGNPDTYVIPHGLTIGHNITVMVQTETSLDASLIRVSSDGVTFDYTTPARRFVMDDGQPYAISVESVLTDCRFSWVSKNINAPIWVFGDSYLSWYPERWTYYAAQDGNLKCSMLNGFAGQASESAYRSLQNLINVTRPKALVWCLGMNDPDDGAVNASWLSCYNDIVDMHEKYGFELVLYTVPTTPIMDNTYKNAVVRASGYRYIDADKAVRINDNGDWVAGALDTDQVHPTSIGAKILYNRILADLPEIMCNM